MMKSWKKTRLGLVCLLAAAMLALSACSPAEPPDDGRGGISVDLSSNQPQTEVVAFFESLEGEALIPLSFSISSSRDTIWIALEKLLAGPPSDFVGAAAPQGLKISELYMEDGVVMLFLTGDAEVAAADLNVAAFAATVNSELQEQSQTSADLMIYYNGQALLEEAFSLPVYNDFGGGAEGAYVYFADSQAMFVAPVCLPIVAEGEPDEAFFGALLTAWAGTPPEGSGLYPVLGGESQLLSVTFEGDLLTLDFSDGLLSGGGTSQETLFIDSLLATLKAWPQVNRVQILVAGETVEYLPHGIEIGQPLEVSHTMSVNPVVQ